MILLVKKRIERRYKTKHGNVGWLYCRSIANTREAIINDTSQIAKIYNDGIEDKIATLETNLRKEENI